MRTRLFAALALTTACGTGQVPVALSPLGRSHVPPEYRFVPTGSAIVLPILDCSMDGPDVVANGFARRIVARRFADGVWEALGLRGPTEEGRIDESHDLCRELSDNAISGTNVVDASPTMRERLRDFFNRYPEKKWLVAVTRRLRPGPRVPVPGAAAGALTGRVTESDTVEVSAYVYARGGDLAYRADLVCSPASAEPAHDCGPLYQRAPERIAELLDGFPRAILASASIVKIPPPDLGPPSQTVRLSTVDQRRHARGRR
jgi:hypothetical protein